MKKLSNIPKDWSSLSDDEAMEYIELIKKRFVLFHARKFGDVITLSYFGKKIKIESNDYRYAVNGKIIKEDPYWNSVHDLYFHYACDRIIWGRGRNVSSEALALTMVGGFCVVFCVLSSMAFHTAGNAAKHRNNVRAEYEKARIALEYEKAHKAVHSPDTCVYGRNMER